MKKVMVIFGTRPEVIKLAPVIHAIQPCEDLALTIVSTNQHIEMLQQMMDVFAIKPDHELNIMEINQSLFMITEKALRGMAAVIAANPPDFILVQGDTTSAFAGALAGFYARVGVGHVEAGLRTGDKHSPYPEEMNRRLISDLADLHFAPTEAARRHLLASGVADEAITVTGNTIVDALNMVRERAAMYAAELPGVPLDGRRLIVVTAHRRENFGEPMRAICHALRRICELARDVVIVFPVHLNPNLRETVFPELSGVPNICLLDPVDYLTMVGLMERAYMILTDSGGIQEETAALGRPTLVLREKTERIEGVEVGVARLVGCRTETIVDEMLVLLRDADAYKRMVRASDCYGDGHAAGRIVDAIRRWSPQ